MTVSSWLFQRIRCRETTHPKAKTPLPIIGTVFVSREPFIIITKNSYLSNALRESSSMRTCLLLLNFVSCIDNAWFAHQKRPIGTITPPAIAGGNRYSGSEPPTSPVSRSLFAINLR